MLKLRLCNIAHIKQPANHPRLGRIGVMNAIGEPLKTLQGRTVMAFDAGEVRRASVRRMLPYGEALAQYKHVVVPLPVRWRGSLIVRVLIGNAIRTAG